MWLQSTHRSIRLLILAYTSTRSAINVVRPNTWWQDSFSSSSASSWFLFRLNIPGRLDQFSLHVFSFIVGEGTGLWWQHIPCLLAGLSWPAWIFAQLPVRWLPNTGVCKEPVGAGDYQCKSPSSSIQLDIVALARDKSAIIDSLLTKRHFLHDYRLKKLVKKRSKRYLT